MKGDTTNTGGQIADGETVAVTGEQLRSLGEGMVEAAAAKVTEQITEPVAQRAAELVAEEIRKGNVPDALRGLLIENKESVKVGDMQDPHRAYTDDTGGLGFAMLARAYTAADGKLDVAKRLIEGWEKERGETPQGQSILRAMNEANFDEGGAFVQKAYSSEVIPLLRNKTLIRQAGARTLSMPSGNLSMGQITSGSTASWRGEGDSATSTQLGTGELNFRSHELVVQVPISKKLLRHSSLSWDVIVRDDAIQAAKLAEDSAFLRSAGTENRPKGLRYHAHADNVFATAGTTIAQVRLDRRTAILRLTNANIALTRPVWFMSERSRLWLQDLANTTSDTLIFPEIKDGKWGQYPLLSSNQVPDNLDTDKSEIILADMFEVFIGEDGTMQVELASNVTYRASDGNLRSAFDRGEVVLQLVQAVDLDVRYKKAVSVITGVAYGA